MDESGWPGGLIVLLSLLATALLARLGSISSALSRSTLERLKEEKIPRASLLLSMNQPRYLLSQLIALGQTFTISVGAVAFAAVLRDRKSVV